MANRIEKIAIKNDENKNNGLLNSCKRIGARGRKFTGFYFFNSSSIIALNEANG